MNKVILIGRLGRDPETKFTGAGQAVCSFQIATDESYKDKNGERQKRTEWHRILLFGASAENAGKILKRGSLVALEGKIQSREYEKGGEKRTAFEVVAYQFHALDRKPDAAETTATKSGLVPRAQIPSSLLDDEIPF